MRKVLFIVLFCLTAILFSVCSKSPNVADAKPKIAATIYPIYDIARNVVGDNMEVICILPPGASPHTFEPSPRNVRELEGVRIVFSVGHGLDNWTDTLVAMLPDVREVVVDKGIHLLGPSEAEEHQDGEHAHEGANPHYWLSISNGEQIARDIAEEVIQLDPAGENRYRENLDAYLAKLDAAKERMQKKIDALPTKKMIAFHDAWAYYAEEFGLQIVGTFEPFPGKQPTPRYLAELQETAQKYGVKCLFSEPQLSSEMVASFVSDIGLKLYILDPLGGVEGRSNYIEMLEYDTDIIAEALSSG